MMSWKRGSAKVSTILDGVRISVPSVRDIIRHSTDMKSDFFTKTSHIFYWYNG